MMMWIRIATMSETTRTFLFGTFVTAGRELTAPQVIALAKPLGISATNVKSHLTRMVADGALQRSGPRRGARYWPSAGKADVVAGIGARLEDHPPDSWDGAWLVLTRPMPSSRSSRERIRAALWFDGFRPWTPDAFVRPAWPSKWAVERARDYLGDGRGFCLHGRLVEPIAPESVSLLYRLDDLDARARQLANWIRSRPIPKSPPATAYAARLRVGGRVARLVGEDPRLPPALWGHRHGMRDLVRAFQTFESSIAPRARMFLDSVLQSDPRRSAGVAGRVKSPSRRAFSGRSASGGRSRRG
jgi:DNA-binding transcriptional regulator PaaX